MATEKAESDVEADDSQAHSRATGGVADPSKPDQHTTTGTTPSGEFVGRVAGEDVGDSGETGAERRAEEARREGSDGSRSLVDEQSSDSFPASDPPANY